MKLLRLELAAFGPYREVETIDFASFDDDGVYLIAGPTGAGKSSILDAVVFALYGGAPRYEGRAHLRSDLAGPEQPTWVELEFAVGARVLCVRRSPEYERPKQRGTGTTKEKAQAQLLERVDGQWQALSTSIGEVGTEVGRIVGLTKEEFLQVILLAQGGFAKFLQATSDDRKQLLQRLFGTGSMRRLRELLQADAKVITDARAGFERTRDEAGARLGALLTGIATDVGGAAVDAHADAGEHTVDAASESAAGAAAESADEVVVDERFLTRIEAALDAHAAAADAAATRARAAVDPARAARDAARELRDRHERRDAAAAALAELEAAAGAIDADRAVLADAERAAEAAAALDRWDRADAAVRSAAAAAEAAALPEDVPAERATVEAAESQGATTLAQAAAALELEQRLPALTREAEDAERRRADADADAAAVRAEREAAPAARAALVDEHQGATTAAAGHGSAAGALEQATAQRDALVRADALEAPLARARQAAADAADAQAAAAALVQRLQAARVAGMAGELAASLTDGEACPVCGSTQHPAPHPPSDEPVSADDVDAALAESARALDAATIANAEFTELDRERAALVAVAGAGDAEALEAAVATARAALDAAASAADERDRLAAALVAHDAAVADLDRRQAERDAEASTAGAAATSARTRLDDARERLAAQIAPHDSAAAMHEAATRRLAQLRAWLAADAEHARALAEQTEAASAGAAVLEAHGLPQRVATAALRRDQAARTALRDRIRAHEAQLASARGVLAQPQLAELDGAVPELAPLEDALRAAEQAAATAERAAAAAATTRDHAATDIALARDGIRHLDDGAAHADAVRSLAAALHGDNELRQDIETYVLATRLGAIIDAANLRLAMMTDGRFTLLHDEATAYRRRASGLGVQVLDAHTGAPRTAASLSGGETFLASLSLALGLADVVQAEAGGVSLETLFVDEGFGSLDQDTLEGALAVLDELRAGGRSVGVISHVQQMQERLPARIRVVPQPGGGSRIAVAAGDAATPG